MVTLSRGLIGKVRYDWDFGDGVVLKDAGEEVTHSYEMAGERRRAHGDVHHHGDRDR